MKLSNLLVLLSTIIILSACSSSAEYKERMQKAIQESEQTTKVQKNISLMTNEEGGLAFSLQVKTKANSTVTTECNAKDFTVIFSKFNCGRMTFSVHKMLTPAERSKIIDQIRKDSGNIAAAMVEKMDTPLGEGIVERFLEDLDHHMTYRLSPGKYQITALAITNGNTTTNYLINPSDAFFEIKKGEIKYLGHWIFDTTENGVFGSNYKLTKENRVEQLKSDLSKAYQKTFNISFPN